MASTLKATTLGKQAKTDLPAARLRRGASTSASSTRPRAPTSPPAGAAPRRRLGRGEVSMTTAKAWRQKGTGRARVGALSVPHRRGGGVAFGPKPRQHTFKVNRKARRRALRSALSVHAERDSVAVLDAGAFDEPVDQAAAEALDKWGAAGADAGRRRRGGDRRR